MRIVRMNLGFGSDRTDSKPKVTEVENYSPRRNLPVAMPSRVDQEADV